jgi:hypothetical protein
MLRRSLIPLAAAALVGALIAGASGLVASAAPRNHAHASQKASPPAKSATQNYCTTVKVKRKRELKCIQETGPRGPRGYTGPAGPRGYEGKPGKEGKAGAQGEKGEADVADWALVAPKTTTAEASLVNGSGFASVHSPSTGIYCLAPKTPIQAGSATSVTGETSYSSPKGTTVPLPEWNAKGENCAAGEVEVETHNALAPTALVEGVAFEVVVG